MLRVCSQILIGNYRFDYVVDAEVNESIETLTNTCSITLPRKFNWDAKKIALGDDPILKRKDKVIVKAGYDDVLKTIFIGYVKDIKSGVPVKIECEDTMFLLKRAKPFTHTFDKNTYLKDVLEFLLQGLKIKYVTPGDKSIFIGALRCTNVTPAQVLEKLKTDYHLFPYFRIINDEPVLYVGLAYWTDNRKEGVLKYEHNIIDDDLVYKKSEDVLLKVKAIGMSTTTNQKIEIEIGDADGEIRTIHHVGLDKDQLKILAEADLQRFKYTGYRGSVTTFGEPMLRAGDVANIIGNKYHEDGKYFIKTIRKRVGRGGYRQVIEINEIANGNKTASVGSP